MKIKTLIYTFIFLFFAVACNESVIESEANVQEQPAAAELKAAAIGTSYYVSKSGNDGNAGTIGSPFLTIQKAANVVNPGDEVIVDDGTYTINWPGGILVQLLRGGTADNPVVFKSKNKHGAVLDGENSVGYGFDIDEYASYVSIQDFEIKNFRNDGIGCNAQILTGGVYVTQPSIYITIEGNKIHDIGRYSTTTDIGISGIYFRKGNHHWTVTRNMIYNIGRTGPSDYWLNKDHAIYIGATDTRENAAHHNVISYNIMWGCSGVAITNGGNYDSILNNVFAWSNENSMGGSPFIAPDSDVTDLTIANNIFYQPPTNHAYALSNLGNIINWSVKNNMVYGGRMWENYGSAQAATMAGGNYGLTDCEHAEVNPLFVNAVKANASNVDFSLLSGSPAINAGINVGLTSDFLKNITLGLPDIGAYEYAVSNPTPTITPTPTVYYNTQKSATATKNDCGTGYTGSTVTYSVPAQKYNSTVSQSDADAKATADLDANKQTYANANGTCTIVPQTAVFYNTEVSATITKKNCDSGYVGSLVTYSVEAKKYSSTVSQADADNKALDDLMNNKQAYADANGTCTPIKIYKRRR